MRVAAALLRCLLAAAAAASVAGAAAADEPRPAPREGLRLLRVTPSGDDVPTTSQIVFQFDRPVVPLGRMARREGEIPIRITPDPDCQWRWLDPSALACQLAESHRLARSTRYRIEVDSGFEALDGTSLSEAGRYGFVTERPEVRYQWFQTWTGPGEPVLRLTLNQAVDGESLARALRFEVPIGPDLPDTERPHGDVSVEVEADEGRTHTWFVRPRHPLPLAEQVALRVVPGIESTEGSVPSVDDRVLASFTTFGPARLLGLSCSDNGEVALFFDATSSPGPDDPRCNPMRSVELVFSAPVLPEVLAPALRVEPDLAGDREDFDPWERLRSYSRLSGAPRMAHRYGVPLPGPLQAWQAYQLRAAAESIRDEFDRPIEGAVDLEFFTDHRPPDLHLGHEAAVLESEAETHLPVVVTNLDEIVLSYQRLTAEISDYQERTLPVAAAEDVAYRTPLPVRDWLDGASGAIAGTISSTPRVGLPRSFFAEVTPYHVHVKIGHYNTLVWVTEMATGESVRGARVEVLLGLAGELDRGSVLAGAKTDRRGVALLPGTDTLDPDRERLKWWRHGEGDDQLFVRVEKDGELALLPLSHHFRLPERGPNRSWIEQRAAAKDGHLVAWGATAQGVYRTGDRVRFKLWIRRAGNERLEAAPQSGYQLSVIDPTDKKVHEVSELSLNDYGSYDGEFEIPKTGAVGSYRFVLETTFASSTLTPLRMLVADFTPAPFRVETELEGRLFAAGEQVSVETRARLHAGGPYRDADSRVVGRVRSERLTPTDPAAEGFVFDTGELGRTELVHRSDATLDAEGVRRTEFALPESAVLYGSLEVESAVRDDRGRYVAGRVSARYVGRDRYVGLLQPDWVLESGKSAEVRAVVVDERGRLQRGTPIDFQVERQVTKAARVKEAGNAYVKRFSHSWEPQATCRAEAALEPVRCAFTPDGPGPYRITARILDTQQREVTTALRRWAVGEGQVLWEEPPGHHLEVTPEQEVLRVGETARYLVRNPFPGALALITVERYGVLRAWHERFEDSSEIVEFEVEPDFLPGFYLSVVLASPRVAEPSTEQLSGELVDLGKPAIRMGYARTLVQDPVKELRIDVEPEREVYEPGDRVVVDIAARDDRGKRVDAELAVAVLDESVLALLPTGSRAYDPYRGFYEFDALDLWNFNLLNRLIGVQQFAQKGASSGGGGGDAGLRSHFEFVSYWNPSVTLSWRGRARVEFDVPDNLTGWRVLVFGATPGDRLGLGEGAFAVNRPTELRPALPNQVLEGDRFAARFTVMNRTDAARTLDVRLRASGDVVGEPSHSETVRVAPYERAAVEIPLEARGPGEIRLDAVAGDELDSDGLRLAVPVGRRSSVEVAATYGSTIDSRVAHPLVFPEAMRTDTGRVSVVASASVLGNLDGAFRYMKAYPYACWEQQLSKGVMASHYGALRPWLSGDLAWEEASELPDRILARAGNFQAPSGGMAYFLPSDSHVSPYLSAYTALAFGWLRADGRAVPSAVEESLHGYLRDLLRRDTLPGFYSKGMASSVRAVALAALAPRGEVELADLERHRPHVREMDLFGKAWFLNAATHIAGSDDIQREVRDAILAHGIQSGGKLVFSETLDDGYARILSSELRSQCSILSAFSALSPEQAEPLGEVAPRLVRAITQTRGRRDHWENTQENLFCTRALLEYAGRYEAEEPDFEMEAYLGAERLGRARFSDRRAPAATFDRPTRPEDRGRSDEVVLSRSGVGRLYYAARLFWAPARLPEARAIAGIDVRREYSVQRDGAWETLEPPYRIRAGELVRVDLFVSLPTARNFVVVADPVPGALEPVNRELATASTVDADEAVDRLPPDSYYFQYDDWQSYAWTRWSFHHRELRHDAARFYSDYLPGGRYHLSYVAQAIATGTFTVLPVRAEEMYDPDVYGRGLPAVLEVGAAP